MRRIAISAAVIGGVVLAARTLAPTLHARMLAACEGMFERLPESFPPKRMMVGIEEIRASTTRILELLEERSQTGEATPQEEPLWSAAEEMETVPGAAAIVAGGEPRVRLHGQRGGGI